MTHEAQTRELFWQPHASQTVESVILMETTNLRPCRLNPRRDFGNLQALAESIKKNKVIDPLIVRLLPEGPEVIWGERRRRAAVLAQVPMVPVIIRDLNDQETLELCLIEAIESKELTDLEKGLACIELKTKFRHAYPDNNALVQRFGVSEDTIGRWIQLAAGVPKEIQALLPREPTKKGAAAPKGTITENVALRIARRIKGPERQLALAKALAQEGLSEETCLRAVDEAARYPGESMPKVIERAIEAVPEVHFTPEQAEMLKPGVQAQVTMLRKDKGIEVGQRLDLYVKLAEVEVSSIEKKALRDFTDEDAKVEGYSLEQFRTQWKVKNLLWNPRTKAFIVKFKVNQLVTRGVQPSTPAASTTIPSIRQPAIAKMQPATMASRSASKPTVQAAAPPAATASISSTITTEAGKEERKEEKTPKVPGASEAAKKYTKLCGLVRKPLEDYKTRFEADYPNDDMSRVLEACHCIILDGKVTFNGG